jgi:acyl-coenzyme A thioesterase PaaI-like protein
LKNVQPVSREVELADDTEKTHAWWQSSAVPAEGTWAEKRKLAASLRRLIGLAVLSDPEPGVLEAAAGEMDKISQQLELQPQRGTLDAFAETSTAGNVHALFDRSPVVGLSNPLSPPMRLELEGDTVRGFVKFGSAYEGPPGHVHGGIVAELFDELLGFAQSITGTPGMTATLTIDYLRPTPLHTDLNCRASVARVEGRKIYAEGELCKDEIVLARGRGMFVSVDRKRMQKMMEEAGLRRDAETG